MPLDLKALVTARLGENYTLEENPGMGQKGLYYYYHTFGKAMTAWGEDRFADAKGVKHAWRADITAALAKRQRADGSWLNDSPHWLEADPNLRPTAQFHAFAVITVTVADRLFGVGSHESKAVKHAWDQVGVAA